MTIYKSFERAKNGTVIPVFQSGRTMESRYNPQRDAENLCSSVDTSANFFLILGIGSGLFIELISQKNPDAKIIALELYEDDIEFLLQNELLKKLSENPLITFTSLNKLQSVLLQNYLPAKYGNLKIIEERAWMSENSDRVNEINSILQKSLGIISADYSVQAHFGKTWNSNIINNSLIAEGYCSYSFIDTKKSIQNKTAVIVAAGPTLEKTLKIISPENERNNYFIIAADTAGQALLKRNIIPDIIVSIDGQSVSYNHFISTKNNKKDKPVYAFDLCANSSAVRHICKADNKVMFFCSGHPLASAINFCNNNAFPTFFSGAGTVTITALDMALQSGFKKILILGADFSYQDGKAYVSGTYLDTLYNKASSKITEAEQIFSKLMFRTELKEISQNIKTTQILEAYRQSLENYLNNIQIAFKKENDIYYLDCMKNTMAAKQTKGIFTKSPENFSLKTFIEKLNTSSIEENELLLLPYIAWLRNNEKYSKASYIDLLKLALESIVSYNI